MSGIPIAAASAVATGSAGRARTARENAAAEPTAGNAVTATTGGAGSGANAAMNPSATANVMTAGRDRPGIAPSGASLGQSVLTG